MSSTPERPSDDRSYSSSSRGHNLNRSRQSHLAKAFALRIGHDPALQFGLIGRAGLMTQGKIDEHRARRFYRPGDVERRRHAERGNSRFFDRACYQPNGLMANGSCRDEEEGVGVGAFEFADNLGSEFIADFARRINSALRRRRTIRQARSGGFRREREYVLDENKFARGG